MSKHTKGPWKTAGFSNMMVRNDNESIIAECKTSNVLPYEEKCANAKLISAAPDLLEALIAAKEELVFLFAQNQNEKFWSEESKARLTKINSAINKAI